MPNIFDEDPYAPQEDPAAVVEHHLGRVGLSLKTNAKLGVAPESPEQAQRKAKASKERLRKHDERWGLAGWGSALTAGDQEGDADVS